MTLASSDLIGIGHLLPGATILKDGKGVTETYEGTIEVDAERLSAIVKFIQPRELFNEAFGSVLCRIAGMQTPDAFVVRVDKAEYPASPMAQNYPGAHAYAFATRALPMQSLMRRTDLQTPQARATLVREWKEWPSVLTFDEWIRNDDRHCGNFLIGSPGEVLLIDHSTEGW